MQLRIKISKRSLSIRDVPFAYFRPGFVPTVNFESSLQSSYRSFRVQSTLTEVWNSLDGDTNKRKLLNYYLQPK